MINLPMGKALTLATDNSQSDQMKALLAFGMIAGLLALFQLQKLSFPFLNLKPLSPFMADLESVCEAAILGAFSTYIALLTLVVGFDRRGRFSRVLSILERVGNAFFAFGGLAFVFFGFVLIARIFGA